MRVHLMHIPKTGGMTAFRALKAAGVDITRGHNPADADELFGEALIITLLRNPVDRAWSAYCYEQRQKYFQGTLREYLDRKPEIWYWGVRNVQARYMRPGVLVDTTENVDRLIRRVCTMAGVEPHADIEWHGRSPDRDYTIREYSMLAAAVGEEDRALYSIFGARMW